MAVNESDVVIAFRKWLSTPLDMWINLGNGLQQETSTATGETRRVVEFLKTRAACPSSQDDDVVAQVRQYEEFETACGIPYASICLLSTPHNGKTVQKLASELKPLRATVPLQVQEFIRNIGFVDAYVNSLQKVHTRHNNLPTKSNISREVPRASNIHFDASNGRVCSASELPCGLPEPNIDDEEHYGSDASQHDQEFVKRLACEACAKQKIKCIFNYKQNACGYCLKRSYKCIPRPFKQMGPWRKNRKITRIKRGFGQLYPVDPAGSEYQTQNYFAAPDVSSAWVPPMPSPGYNWMQPQSQQQQQLYVHPHGYDIVDFMP